MRFPHDVCFKGPSKVKLILYFSGMSPFNDIVHFDETRLGLHVAESAAKNTRTLRSVKDPPLYRRVPEAIDDQRQLALL